jgi:ATP-dependent helicase/nuclease subunit B
MKKFSDAFLAKVATRIFSNHNKAMHHACVVLPNRRAGIFLKRHLSNLIQSPAYAPAIFSIEDFVFELSGLNHADQLVLLWELYECYAAAGNGNRQSFEEFLKWARVLLQDFEDTDMHLVDPGVLFHYLSEAKAIELWNPGKDFLTAGQQKYLAFYRSLGTLYTSFTTRLIHQKMAYKGLAFRQLASLINDKQPALKWEHLYFAGFNAITPAELRIIEGLAAIVQVTRLFDADAYYLDDPKQEAGKYLRKIARNSKSQAFEWVGKRLTQNEMSITITGVPHNTGQVLVVGSLLATLDPEESNKTAVVLNDESLLIPLLNAIPDNIAHFNVTMGFPFSLTPAYELMDSLLKMHLYAYDKAPKSVDDESSGLWFYFRHVAAVLNHPYIQQYILKQCKEADDPVAALLSQGKVFFLKDDIFRYFGNESSIVDLLNLAFENWADAAKSVDHLALIIKSLASAMAEEDESDQHKMNLEYLYQLSLILNRLKWLVSRAGEEMNLRGLHRLIKSIASTTQLPFTGEPLKGVQIMGMLETRALDFKNIIMLSVNEGVLPTAKHANSFVPFDIRRGFGLPVYSDRDAVFAYHFYRLMQGCENLHLVYNTTPDDLGGGEKSRFILQIEHELARINPNIKFGEQFYTPPARFDPVAGEIAVDKTAVIAQRLEEMAQHGFSPTALSAYVSCPLKFYFSYVLRISEESSTDDAMDAPTFGSGIHDTLEELYQTFVNQALTVEMLEQISGKAAETLHRNFLKAFNNNDLSYGRNLLMVKVAESFLRRFVRNEKEEVEALRKEGKQLIIKAVEYNFAHKSPVTLTIKTSGNKTQEVRLRGKADRIDQTGEIFRIIDFKTGTVDKKELKLNNWEELLNDPGKSKSLQLLVYAYLYARQFSAPLPESGIISFRHLDSGFMGVALPTETSDPVFEIGNILQQILKSIFDVLTPFQQTDDLNICQRCSFAGVCGR